MSIEELEAESGRIYDIIADIEAGEPPSLDDVQWMIQRIAELEEALDMLAITTRKYRSLPRIDGDTIGRLEAELSKALEKARAALEGDAPKEDAEYWKARCLLERIAREVRDDDFADDYTIAYEVMDEDTADVAALEGDAPIVCGAHQEGAVGLPKGAS